MAKKAPKETGNRDNGLNPETTSTRDNMRAGRAVSSANWRRPSVAPASTSTVTTTSSATGLTTHSHDAAPATPAAPAVQTGTASTQPRDLRALTSKNWRQSDLDIARAAGPAPSAASSRAPRVFRPMDVVSAGRSVNANITAEERKWRGYSQNYGGDPLNPNNRSADIHPLQSTSLYLERLPADTTVKSLLDAIMANGPFGKVHVASITPPDPYKRLYYAAAKIAMFTRGEAQVLEGFISRGKLIIDGHVVLVKWNKHLFAPFRMLYPGKDYMSRVLIISGPKDLVNVERLYRFFASKFQFATQDVFLEDENVTERTIKWVFGSLYAQARSAHLALKEDEWADVSVHFGADPIALGTQGSVAGRNLIHQLPALDNFRQVVPEEDAGAGEEGGGEDVYDVEEGYYEARNPRRQRGSEA